MTTQQIQKMMIKVSEQMIAKEELLCKLDGYIGDGDHGVTVARGFTAVKKNLETNEYTKPAEVFKAVGDSLSKSMGGAIGPILGSLFVAGASKKMDETEFDAEDFSFMFEKGLNRIQIVGGAKVGDRTMVDAISPAVDEMKLSADNGKTVLECLEAGMTASAKGAENTKTLVAKKGRAKFLGEKSLGYVDAGATTVSLILKYMYDFVKEG